MRALVLLFLILIFLAPTTAWAEQTHWSLGTDVFPWTQSGYSVLVGVEPEGCPGCRVQLEVWGFDFPELFVELSGDNADEGWRRRADIGTALFLDHQSESGWHAGLVLSAFHSTLSREGEAGEMWSVEVLGRLGWRFLVFEGLYLDPWVAAGPLWPITPEPEVAGERFEEPAIQILGTLHLGWRFWRPKILARIRARRSAAGEAAGSRRCAGTGRSRPA